MRRQVVSGCGLALAFLVAVAGCAGGGARPPPSTRLPPPPAVAKHAGALPTGPREPLVNWLGPNWLGPNWLGPNGVVQNGLAANGLGSNWLGPNGLDPATGIIGSARFRTWFEQDRDGSDKAMAYFVRCAYPAGKTITYQDASGATHSWTGRFGLAASGFASQTMSVDEGRWVSACLLAFVNTQGTHQYVSLRGNPPLAASKTELAPTPAELWTMSYREGVFAGDIFASAPACGGSTFPMNYTQGYDVDDATWRPPNAVLGRTLDFSGWTGSGPPSTCKTPFVNVIEVYGTCKPRFRSTSAALDPTYDADGVCLAPPTGSTCASNAETYHPLFVHEARLANYEDAHAAPATAKAFEVIASGPAIAPAQLVQCATSPGSECVGSYQSPGSGTGGKPGPGAKLVSLGSGQTVAAVLRLPQGTPADHVPPPGHPYTAIVRYASAGGATAPVRVRNASGAAAVTQVAQSWPATGSSDTYRWLQIYPVFAAMEGPAGSQQLTLRIEISGPASGAAPELDAVGFVPGRPWCRPNDPNDPPFAGSCPP